MKNQKKAKGERHFHKFSIYISNVIGSMWAFILTTMLILSSGIYFEFSSAWKQIISFILTLLTFIFLFILQKFQNVENKAIHLKLDEIIRSIKSASNEVIFAEDKTEEEIDELKAALIKQTFEEKLDTGTSADGITMIGIAQTPNTNNRN